MYIGRFSALLDACVLHPVHVRGAHLWLASARTFRPLWSDAILDEWIDSLRQRFSDLTEDALAEYRSEVASGFPDACVSGHMPLVECLTLPDPDDRHVLAAAIVGHANAIVTTNDTDFPSNAISAYGIEIVHPDTFIVNLIDLDPPRAIEGLKLHRQSLTKSTPDAETYLSKFERFKLPQSHARLKPLIGLL